MPWTRRTTLILVLNRNKIILFLSVSLFLRIQKYCICDVMINNNNTCICDVMINNNNTCICDVMINNNSTCICDVSINNDNTAKCFFKY